MRSVAALSGIKMPCHEYPPVPESGDPTVWQSDGKLSIRARSSRRYMLIEAQACRNCLRVLVLRTHARGYRRIALCGLIWPPSTGLRMAPLMGIWFLGNFLPLLVLAQHNKRDALFVGTGLQVHLQTAGSRTKDPLLMPKAGQYSPFSLLDVPPARNSPLHMAPSEVSASSPLTKMLHRLLRG